jgi:hypothetical protein
VAATKVGGAISVVQEQADLGNLAAPHEPWIAAGVWWTGDHRFPLPEGTTRTTLNYVAIAIVLALAVVAVACAVRRRDLTLVALGFSAAVALPVVTSRAGPWVDQKAFALTAPICIALAFGGAAALDRGLIGRVGAWLGTLVVAGAVLYGSALAYHNTTLTPYDRFADLARIGKRFAGEGPALYPAFDEYAEFFLRREQGVSLVNPPKSVLRIRADVLKEKAGQQFVYDLDDFEADYLQSFRLIVERRAPGRSRPPGNYRLVERTRFHRVWRREPGSGRLLAHLPLDGADARTRRFCRDLGRRAGIAGPAARIRYSTAERIVVLRPGEAAIVPSSWYRADGNLIPFGSGRVVGELRTRESGRYNAWLEGSTGRPLRFTLDGRPLEEVAYDMGYGGGYVRLGALDLPRGRHTIEIKRGRGSLHPGSGNSASGYIGPFVLSLESRETGNPVTVSQADGVRACRGGRHLDWMEVVVPRR